MEILLRQPVMNLLHENGQFLLRYSKKNEIFVDFRDGNALDNDNASRRGSIDFFTDFSKMLELEVSKNWPILSSNYGGGARLLLYTAKTRFYSIRFWCKFSKNGRKAYKSKPTAVSVRYVNHDHKKLNSKAIQSSEITSYVSKST